VSLSDFELVDEIRGGSRSAFDELMRRHQRLVYSIAFSCTRDMDSALDVSQNVFLKVHRKLDSFAGRSSFRSWLSRIAHRESLNWIESQNRHGGHEDVHEARDLGYEAVQDLAMQRAERTRDLRAEVDRLHPRQREAVMLRYYEHMPIREIGEVLDCSEGQVKSLLFRGLQKLRTHLAKQPRWNQELEA